VFLYYREGGARRERQGTERLDVYFDHPYHAPLDHALSIDFVNEANGAKERVAIEISADSARELVRTILAALASGETAHQDA
jgi:hypothetical protein